MRYAEGPSQHPGLHNDPVGAAPELRHRDRVLVEAFWRSRLNVDALSFRRTGTYPLRSRQEDTGNPMIVIACRPHKTSI